MIGIPLPVDLLASLGHMWLVGCTVMLGAGLGVAAWAVFPELRSLIDGRQRPARLGAHAHIAPATEQRRAA